MRTLLMPLRDVTGPDTAVAHFNSVAGGGFIDREIGGSSGAGAAGSSGGPSSSTAVGSSGAAGSFVINVTYDQAPSTLPSGFVAAINYVVSYYESIFTSSATVNIDVGYGEIDGQSLGSGALGESETYIDSDSYSQVVTALKSNATSSAQQAAYATLPATSPLTNGTLWLATAEEKALGLIPASSDIDGYVGFSSVYPFSYSANVAPPSGEYYFIGVVEHEFSEVMGRDLFLGDGIAGTTSYSVMDLFRYSAPGERDLTATPPVANTAYFSIDNGNTNFASWNTSPNGDLGDWASTARADAYLAFSPSGQVNSVTSTDLELMNILGYQESTSTSSSGPSVVSGGVIYYVSSGQSASGINVLSGGILEVVFGGVSISAVVSGGGEIANNGLASGTQVSGGLDYVLNGAEETGATLFNGGLEVVEAGGVASGAVVSSGGELANYGLASGTRINAGGTDLVQGGGEEVGATIGSGGIEIIDAGGVASGAVILVGSEIANYGSAAHTQVSGGLDYVLGGAEETDATIAGGGVEVVEPGGVISGAVILSGGEIANYGSASGTRISGGGTDYVQSGAQEVGATITSGGLDVVDAGGFTNGALVLRGGEVVNNGLASGTQVSGGVDYIQGGAKEVGATIASGGIDVVGVGGVANGAVVSSGGEFVNNGSASGTRVSGGLDYVLGGAQETAATIASGGTDIVEAGGVTNGTVISSGGVLINYGTALGARLSGGLDYLQVGATESNTTIAGGGIDVVEAGAIANGAVVSSGGYEYVEAGGTASGVTISGGTVDVISGGVFSGTVIFSSSGELILSVSQNFHGLVAGFSGTSVEMDLLDIPYVASGGTAAATTVTWNQIVSGSSGSGTLTVSGGGHVANITLIGQYATGNFSISSDGNGGTLVTDPPITAGQTAQQTLTTPPHHA